MADSNDSGWVLVIERLFLVFGAQFSLPGLETGSVEHRGFGLLVAKRGSRLQLGDSKAYSADRNE